ncbi:MAG: hypothetical protein L6R36_009192, partial [Xanthoria steineri]
SDISLPILFSLACIGSLAIYTLYGVIWRIYLSPIAHIPGPRFAALTFWNEFYYDVWLGGRYTWKLLDYHEQYGLRSFPVSKEQMLNDIRTGNQDQPVRSPHQ